MRGDFAYIDRTHHEPPHPEITEFDLVIRYGDKGARLNIRLEQPLDARLSPVPILAAEFREIASALLRIADQPKAILGHNPNRS